MISIRQNSEINIQRLAAQRRLYQLAKTIHVVRLLLAIPMILLIAVVVAIMKSQVISGIPTFDASWVLTFTSLIVFGVDNVFFGPMQENRKSMAAAIQEEFDCDVLQIPWNDVMLPKHPARDEIISQAQKYLKKHDRNKLMNWYICPDEQQIPSMACKVICQHTNLLWDSRLRQKYIMVISISGLIASLMIIILATSYNLTLRNLLINIIAPLLPVIKFTVEEMRNNRASVNNLSVTREKLEEIWNKLLNDFADDTEICNKIRQIQDKIYINRKLSPLIPDILYEILRGPQNSLISSIVEQMADQYFSQHQYK